jgi:NAD(P)-dependent dehydrogenase (short-subunit alcohol dehydrogenase family)
MLADLLGTHGLGKAACIEFAKHNPAHIYIAGRREEIADVKAANPSVPVSFLNLDLSSLESIREASKKFASESQRLDILVNNAGVMALAPGLSKEGYEIQFGINQVGHALLTKLLMPTLLKTAEIPGADVRIIFMTSQGHMFAPKEEIAFKDLKTTQEKITSLPSWVRYGQSKLANILYAAELARRYPAITSLSVHPGVVRTGLKDKSVYDSSIYKLVQESILPLLYVLINVGIKNQLWASCSDKKELNNGGYYEPIGMLIQF